MRNWQLTKEGERFHQSIIDAENEEFLKWLPLGILFFTFCFLDILIFIIVFK